jgi:hypothetical protein
MIPFGNIREPQVHAVLYIMAGPRKADSDDRWETVSDRAAS